MQEDHREMDGHGDRHDDGGQRHHPARGQRERGEAGTAACHLGGMRLRFRCLLL